MTDYLEKLCVSLGIKLVYMTNKVTIITSGIKNGIPMLRVHREFKSCPEDVATAIIGYYTGSRDKDMCLKVIDAYIEERFSQKQYKLQIPNEELRGALVKNMPAQDPDEVKEDLMAEFKIYSIEQTDFYGYKTKVDSKGTIKPPMDDVLELNIVVMPPSGT